RSGIWRAQDCAFGGHTLVHPKTKIGRRKWRIFLKEKIIEFRAVLASDLNRIRKSRSGHKGHACAFALQQRVGAHGGAVQHDSFCMSWSNHGNGFSNGLRRISRSGKYFQDSQCGVFQPHAIGERPTTVNGNSEGKTSWHELSQVLMQGEQSGDE